MAINVEIKARATNLEGLRQVVEELCGAPDREIRQEDVFFQSSTGRLKLRIIEPRLGQLIYYERPDRTGPKQSHYFLSKTNDPDSLRQVMEHGLGVRGVVRKMRRVYLHGQTRIHLDQVEGLGDFIELEVVLRPGQDAEVGTAIARDLMALLRINEEDLVSGAYIDLLEKGRN